VIPALIKKCLEAKAEKANEIVLWGDGSASREFLHVDDAARAVVLAAENYDDPAPVNIGSGSEITIKELALKIAELTRFDGELVWDTTKPNGQQRRKLDTSRASERFGFRSEVSFDQGLAQTLEWYKSTQCASTVTAAG
jgi:GDP-L-fucose synthase